MSRIGSGQLVSAVWQWRGQVNIDTLRNSDHIVSSDLPPLPASIRVFEKADSGLDL